MRHTETLVPAGSAGEIGGRGPIDDIYASWKQAEAAARALERQVRQTWNRYERGVGAFPSSGLLREAAALRHAAREKLGDVVGRLHAAGHL
jgi:hypothetical protein